jgi:phage baseplate assembly protein W
MIRKRQEFKRSVADSKPNTGIGVALPFNASSVFTTTYTTKEQVKSNLLNFLLTNRGERPFNPAFGADIRAFLFDPMVSIEEKRELLNDRIRSRFYYIAVDSVNIDTYRDNNTILITISYHFNNTSDTLTIQFD